MSGEITVENPYEGSSARAEHDLSPEQLLEAQRYGKLSLRCDLADMGLDVAFLLVMTFCFARPIAAWMETWPGWAGQSHFLHWAAIFLIVMGLHILVSFPLSYYAGFVLEHKFALSRMTFRQWFWRFCKRNTLAVVFGGLMAFGLYALMRFTGPTWWAWAAGAFFLISVVLGQLAPVLLLPLFYKIQPLDDAELKSRMSRLAEGTGLNLDGLFRLDLSAETTKANAMLAGLGRTRRVLLGDTLLKEFSPDEIEVIIAHEIGHHVHKHIPKMIGLGLGLSALGFWLCNQVIQVWVSSTEGHFEAADYRYMPVYVLPLFMLWTTGFSLFMQPFQNAVSRFFERQCDRYALARTGLRSAYISAFQKLARLNKDDPHPHPLEVWLFHSHPPIHERLSFATEPLQRSE